MNSTLQTGINSVVINIDLDKPSSPQARVWSAEQNAIFTWFRDGKGNLVVQARAGTGKTTTIKQAFSYAPEPRILYVVFNKKNQIEAQATITDSRVDVLTLHALGYRFIRLVWSNARPDDFVELDRAKAACGYGAPDAVIAAVRKLMGLAKNRFINPTFDDLFDLADSQDVDTSEYAYMSFGNDFLVNATLKALDLSKQRDSQNRISFDDMVWLPVALNWVKATYPLVTVDETQDMNIPQLTMVRKACLPSGRMALVGDDRQAIYVFRGAASDGMGLMIRELSAQVLGLTTTYRCPKAVVALAQAIVPDYKADSSAPEGLVSRLNASAAIETLIAGDAVLSRKNAPLMPICLNLIRLGKPARIEGKDIGKTLLAIVRKLKANSVPQFITKLNNWADKQRSRFAGSKNVDSKTALINDQTATLEAIADGVSNVREIETRITELFQDSNGNSKPAIVLSSVHKAKGLEWDKVCLITSTFKTGETVGEESNIYYVALTRAKKELVFLD